MANLTTIAQIRTLCGFKPQRVVGAVLGQGDWQRKAYPEPNGAVFASLANDVLTPADIVVYDDGAVVVVEALSENGVVLAAAPGGRITADYYASNVPSSYVSAMRAHAEAEVAGRLSEYTVEQLASSPLVQKITTYLAAAEITDAAYNDTGVGLTGNTYPPDRLRRVAYNLLDEINRGVLVLTDTTNAVIPVVEEIDTWIDESTYGDRDRLFERDPFDATSGVLNHRIDSTWRWNV